VNVGGRQSAEITCVWARLVTEIIHFNLWTVSWNVRREGKRPCGSHWVRIMILWRWLIKIIKQHVHCMSAVLSWRPHPRRCWWPVTLYVTVVGRRISGIGVDGRWRRTKNTTDCSVKLRLYGITGSSRRWVNEILIGGCNNATNIVSCGRICTKYLCCCFGHGRWRCTVIMLHLIQRATRKNSLGRLVVVLPSKSATVVHHLLMIAGKSGGVIIVADYFLVMKVAAAFSWPRSRLVVVLRHIVPYQSLHQYHAGRRRAVVVRVLGVSGNDDVGLCWRWMLVLAGHGRYWRRKMNLTPGLYRLDRRRILTRVITAAHIDVKVLSSKQNYLYRVAQ